MSPRTSDQISSGGTALFSDSVTSFQFGLISRSAQVTSVTKMATLEDGTESATASTSFGTKEGGEVQPAPTFAQPTMGSLNAFVALSALWQPAAVQALARKVKKLPAGRRV